MSHLETRIYEIRTDKLNREDRPLRILLLADLHDRLWGEGQTQLLREADRFPADLILCAGDMVLGQTQAGMEHALLLFERLSERGVPIIAGNGNHESRMRQMPERYGRQYETYARRLGELGVKIPVNETIRISHGSMQVQIHGYELPLEYYRKFFVKSYDGRDLQEKLGTQIGRASCRERV